MSLQKALLIAIISLQVSIKVFGQTSEANTIQTIVKEIAENGIYERSYTVGYAGSVLRQMRLFERLTLIATEADLAQIALTHKNAVVRLYALQAIKQKAKELSKILRDKFERDNSEVTTLTGCLGSKKSVRSLAFESIVEGKVN